MIMIHNFIKNKNKQGFTLIETFVAITILMIAILGPMSIISKFYADSNYAKNQIAASFLAQDGMETIENIVNNNTGERFSDRNCVVDNKDWLDKLSDCASVNGGCSVDSLNNRVEPCQDVPTNPGCMLTKKGDGFYGLSNIGNTIFRRKITIDNLAGNPVPLIDDMTTFRREARVTSQVWWREKARTHSVTVSNLIIQFQCK